MPDERHCRECRLVKWISRSLLTALVLGPSIASASGMVEMPPRRERMGSRLACIAFLEERAVEDAHLARPESVDADGSRHSVTVETRSKGVERTGRNRARYSARIWYGHGIPRPDLGQIVYRASWDEHTYECKGRMLEIRTAQGFTNENYEPLPAAPEAAQQGIPGSVSRPNHRE
jgi:hypothetical protein